jgi:hypothetical protein
MFIKRYKAEVKVLQEGSPTQVYGYNTAAVKTFDTEEEATKWAEDGAREHYRLRRVFHTSLLSPLETERVYHIWYEVMPIQELAGPLRIVEEDKQQRINNLIDKLERDLGYG